MSIETPRVAPSVAITGAGSGLGREIAIGFAHKGYRVFGTVRKPQEVEEVQNATHGAARMTICDITHQDGVQPWAKATSDGVGDAGLDVLVSNILTPGPLEVLSIDSVRHEFEVNVFGSLTAINACLPALRRAEGGSCRSGR